MIADIYIQKVTFLLLILPSLHSAFTIETCTNKVQSCPRTEELWVKRAKELNCQNYNYTCMGTTQNELVEGCIPVRIVNEGIGRCPLIILCDGGYPLLALEQSFKECPEEVYGCPERNHSSFSVHELYKYPACLVKEFSDLRTTQTYGTKDSHTTSLQTGHDEASTGSSSSYTTSVINLSSKKDEEADSNEYHSAVVATGILCSFAILCPVSMSIFFLKGNSKRRKCDVEAGSLSCTRKLTERCKKRGLRDIAWETNNQISSALPMSPLERRSNIKFSQMFVPPVVQFDSCCSNDNKCIPDKGFEENKTIALGSEKISCGERESKGDIIDIFHQNSKRIFLLGDAGIGKTTYCKWLLHLWCKKEEDGIFESEKSNPLQKSLKKFDFVFFIPLERYKDSIKTLDDIICEEVLGVDYYLHNELRKVLSSNRYHCLILIDGAGQWNPYESVRMLSRSEGIPNLGKLSNCTILITSRPSEFHDLDMAHNSDAVFRILGLDTNGAKSFANNLEQHLHSEFDSKLYDDILKTIQEIEMPTDVEFTVNPLLTSTVIQMMYQTQRNEDTLTVCLIKFISLLIEIAEQKHGHHNDSKVLMKNTNGLNLPVQENYHFLKSIRLLQNLGKTAYNGTLPRQYQTDTLVFSLGLTESELAFALNVGLLIKEDADGVLTRKVNIRFLNSCIKDLLGAVYIVGKKENSLGEERSATKLSSMSRFAKILQRYIAEEIENDLGERKDRESSNEVIHNVKLQTLSQNSLHLPGSTKMEGNWNEDGFKTLITNDGLIQ